MKNILLGSVVLLGLVVASSVMAAANSITIAVTGPSPAENVSQVVLGNMVDPEEGGDWSSAPDGKSSWKWKNDGDNVKKFAVMVNFKGGVPASKTDGENTAIGAIAIDPTQLNGDVDVKIGLVKCSIGNGNNQYKVTTSSSGAKAVFFGTQPKCN